MAYVKKNIFTTFKFMDFRYTANLLFTDTKRPAQLVSAGNALPDIRLVITDYCKGAVNDVIYMIVRNVDKVMVSILSADGRAIEVGSAIRSGAVWSYRAAAANAAFPGAKVIVTAEDVQGNRAKLAVPVF